MDSQKIYKHFAAANLLKVETTQPIYKYILVINSEDNVELKKLQQQIRRSLQLSFDIDTCVIAEKQISSEPSGSMSIEVNSKSQHSQSKNQEYQLYTNKQIDINQYKFQIFGNRVDVSISSNSFVKDQKEKIEVINLVMKQIFDKLEYLEYNGSLYNPIDPPNAALNSDRSVVYQTYQWNGVRPTAIEFRNKCYLQVETTPIRMLRMNVFEVIKKLTNQSYTQNEIERFLVGKTVKTNYFSGGSLFYTIQQVNFQLTPESAKNAEGATLIEEVKNKYRINLRDKIQPILIVKPQQQKQESFLSTPNQQEELLISSLCAIFEKTGEKNVLEDHLLGLEWCSEPLELYESLLKVTRFLQSSGEVEDLLNKWQIKVHPEWEQVGFNFLRASNLLLKNPSSQQSDPVTVTDLICRRLVSEFDRYYSQIFCGQRQFHKFCRVDSWVVFMHKANAQLIEKFMSKISQLKIYFNYQLSEPKYISLDTLDREEWKQSIEQGILQHQPQYAVIIVPQELETSWFYTQCLSYLTIQKSIPCQFIRASKLTNKVNNEQNSYSQNNEEQQTQLSEDQTNALSCRLLAQMTAKLGESPWLIQELPFNSVPTTMMGFNVLRDDYCRKIIVSGTCSVNKHYSKYQSDFRVINELQLKSMSAPSQEAEDTESEISIEGKGVAQLWIEKTEEEIENEIASAIKEMTNTFLNSFLSLHKTSPTWIIIIRDGYLLNNSQNEKNSIISSLQAKRSSSDFKSFHVIFCTAEYLTVFRTYQFSGSSNENANSTNVYSLGTGAIIEQTADKKQFYLFTSKVIKNCPFATKYNVLHVDKKAQIDELTVLYDLQELLYNTYLLNYTYSPKTTYPACLQNARKFAVFLKPFLQDQRSPSLTIDLSNLKVMASSYKLFYL